MKLIGLNGLKGSGKDTAGSYLVEKYGFARLSFAGPLKQSAAAALGIIIPDEVSAADFWDEYKNDPHARVKLVHELRIDPIADISVREYLQFYGTEAHRDIFGADFWTRILIDRFIGDVSNTNYVITDARFVNECTAVREVGGTIIEIVRHTAITGDGHVSEAPLPADLVDTTIYNNGTIEYLYETLDAYMNIDAEGGS